MKRTLMPLFAAFLIGAYCSSGCSKKQQPELAAPEARAQYSEQAAAEQPKQIPSKLEKEAAAQPVLESKKDFSTPITRVSLYNLTSNVVEAGAEYAVNLGPHNLKEYNCFIKKDKNSSRYAIFFNKELLEFDVSFFKGWGGAVYGSEYCNNILQYTKTNGAKQVAEFFGMRIFPDNMTRIRIEAQDKEQQLGTTYRDEFQLHPNKVNDILVDLRRLATNSSGSRLEHITEIKIVAEPSYMTSNFSALMIYNMGLK